MRGIFYSNSFWWLVKLSAFSPQYFSIAVAISE